MLVRELAAGDVVVIDRSSSHERDHIRELIESTGARLLLLPPYNPDLSPIVLIFPEAKQRLRSLVCRRREPLWEFVQSCSTGSPQLTQSTTA
ncbi:MAG TPA: transposase [Tepidisphaeraceae bacterium]|nr:transposase [Tepidisphaeraceae bacterium]